MFHEDLIRKARFDRIGRDVEKLFADGTFQVPWPRSEVELVVRELRAERNVLLVGRRGIGKLHVALSVGRSLGWNGLLGQQVMDLGTAPPGLHPAAPVVRLVHLHDFLENCFCYGDPETKIAHMYKKLRSRTIALFPAIEAAHGAWRSSSESGQADLLDLLVPLLRHPLVGMVATTTNEGLAMLLERHQELVSLFNLVRLPEPDGTLTRLIAVRSLAARSGGCESDASAADKALELARFHFGDEPLLGSVMRILRAAAADDAGAVSVESVCFAGAAILGQAREWVGGDRVPTVASVIGLLEANVCGQSEACRAIAEDVVARAHRLLSTDRPLSYVLYGPPGNGKTTTALRLQSMLVGTETRPVVLDCTEYSQPFDVARLVATIATGLDARRSAVVVLNEIEKAHPACLGPLYEALEGHVTMSDGAVVSTANATFVLTTNVGAEQWLKCGDGEPMPSDAVGRGGHECRTLLGPALASRMTRFIAFPSLSVADGTAIVELELRRFAARPGLTDRGLRIVATPQLVAALADIGMSSSNGVRGVRKAVDMLVARPVSQLFEEQNVRHSRLELDAIVSHGLLDGVRINVEAIH